MEGAVILGMMLQEKVENLQATEYKTTEKMLALEYMVRQFNLKFHGLHKQYEGATEITCYITNWLVMVLTWEEGVAPTIGNA